MCGNRKFAGMKGRFLILLSFGLWLISCSKEFKGDLNENQAPETFMLADTIIRQGDNRFQSVIEVNWSGMDPDGYIKGFEISLDGSTWTFTTSQDSTLTLSLPGNSDTFDFTLYVRAIDNLDLADPTPAQLTYPVKNSDPNVEFIIPAGSPVRSFPAVKYFWVGSDPDGDASLDHYELIWNDTTLSPLKLSTTFSEASFVAKDLSGSQSACSVFPGTLNTAITDEIQGMKLGDENFLYIRSVDKVGATSRWVASPAIFIRKPVSDILFINAQRSAFNRSNVQSFYTNKIYQSINKSFDTLQAGPEGGVTDLSADPTTQDRVFSFFKKIFVYSENSEFILSLMQRSSTRYFTNGGKLLLITEGNDGIEDQTSYLDFSPMASYVPRPDNVSLLFNLSDSLYPTLPNYPSIYNGSTIISGVRPFILANNNSSFRYEAFYNGSITQDSSGNIGTWKGGSTLSARRIRASDNKTDFVIMMLPIYAMKHDTNLDTWFQRMLVDELEF